MATGSLSPCSSQTPRSAASMAVSLAVATGSSERSAGPVASHPVRTIDAASAASSAVSFILPPQKNSVVAGRGLHLHAIILRMTDRPRWWLMAVAALMAAIFLYESVGLVGVALLVVGFGAGSIGW